MKNKKSLLLLVVFAACAFAGGNILAQEAPANPANENALQPYIVATVGISGQKIVSQNGNDIKFSFDIYNGRSTQPGIKYAARLIETNGEYGSVVDEKVYDDIVSLNTNEKKHKELSYSAPSFLKGNFRLAIIAFTDSGMKMAEEAVGEIVLNGSGEYLRIVPESCSLIVEGDNSKTYFINQGVDIKPEETLIARCFVENKFKGDVNVSANLATHYRTSLGQKIAEEDKNNISFSSGENRMRPAMFRLPKAGEPQAYDCVLSFQDGQGRTVSNKIPFHYVLRGASATIQNLRLDKASYVNGDVAIILLDITPSADSFVGSRFGQTYAGQVFLDITINDDQGQECSQIKGQAVSDRDLDKSMDIAMTMARDCSSPKVSAKVKNKEGQVLASQNYFVGDDVNTGTIAQYEKKQKELERSFFQKNRNTIILLIIALIPILALIFHLIRRKDSRFTIFILMVVSGLFMLSSEARGADFPTSVTSTYLTGINETVTIPGGRVSPDDHYINRAIYNIKIGASAYQVGETLVATATTKDDMGCANGLGMSAARVTVDGYAETEIYDMSSPNYQETKTFDIEECPYNDDFGVKNLGTTTYPCQTCDVDGNCYMGTCTSGGYGFDPANNLGYGMFKYKGSSSNWFRGVGDEYSPVFIRGYFDKDYNFHNFKEKYSSESNVIYQGSLNYTITYSNTNGQAGFDKCKVGYYGAVFPSNSKSFMVKNVAPVPGSHYAKFSLLGFRGYHDFYMPYSVNTPSSAFNLNLQINKTGEGNGSVSFSPANGAKCSASCTKTYNSGISVIMTANPSGGSDISWGSGCDSKSGNSCRVNMNSDKDVSVTFSKPTPPLPSPPESTSKEWKEVAP